MREVFNFMLRGRVETAAEQLVSMDGTPLDAMVFKVRLTQGSGDWAKEVVVEVEAWSRCVAEARELRPGQGVQVSGTVNVRQGVGLNGKPYSFQSFRGDAILYAPAAAASGSGVASPPSQARRQQQYGHPSTPQGGYAEAGGNYGSGTYTPPANGREAAPLPHEDEEDYPF